MIEKALFENFQRHELREIELDPGITTLVGDSDTGKSSLIRGFRWLFLNRPRGGGMVRWGERLMRVRSKVDGVTVRRERDGDDNLYKLGKEEYKAFREEVPPSIRDLLRVSDYNFQGQYDAPFWVGLSPPELARQLNKLVDLDSIDNITSQLETMLRGLKAEQKVVAGRRQEAEQRVEETACAPVLDASLKCLEQMEEDEGKLRKKIKGISDTIDEISLQERLVSTKKTVLLCGKQAVETGKGLKDLSQMYNKMVELVESIEETQKLADVCVPDVRKLTKIRDAIADVKSSRDGLLFLFNSITTDEASLVSERNNLTRAKQKLREETKGLCPICGGELKE